MSDGSITRSSGTGAAGARQARPFRIALPLTALVLAALIAGVLAKVLLRGEARREERSEESAQREGQIGRSAVGTGSEDRTGDSSPTTTTAGRQLPRLPTEPAAATATAAGAAPTGAQGPIGSAPARSPIIGPRGVPYAPRTAADTLNHAGVPGGRPLDPSGESFGAVAGGGLAQAGTSPAGLGSGGGFRALDSPLSPIRNSGEPTEAGAKRAQEGKEVLETLADSLDADVRAAIEFSAVECYAAGCFIKLRYQSMDIYNRARTQFFRDPLLPFNRWTGLRQLIRPVTEADGRVVSGWILLPDAG